MAHADEVPDDQKNPCVSIALDDWENIIRPNADKYADLEEPPSEDDEDDEEMLKWR